MVASESGEVGNPGTLGMTILFGNAKYSFQDELSSRPERSVAEGSGVRPSAFLNSGVIKQTAKSRRLFFGENLWGNSSVPITGKDAGIDLNQTRRNKSFPNA